MKSKENRF